MRRTRVTHVSFLYMYMYTIERADLEGERIAHMKELEATERTTSVTCGHFRDSFG